MIATHNQAAQQSSQDGMQLVSDSDAENNVKTLARPSSILLPNRMLVHHPKAGLNPLVDAASYLFSVVGKLKGLKTHRQLNKLQKELMQEVTILQEAIEKYGYNPEYNVICRYIVCATIDDIIANTVWGGQGQWEPYCLLGAFAQDAQHQDKFFIILERAVKEPAVYIDLMELIYLCLSMGYKGQYRITEHSQYQLEQIINNLYKHIRAYRGNFSKTLSPAAFKPAKTASKNAAIKKSPLMFIFCVTACIIMAIFIGLGYLMDIISNEAYKNIAQIQAPTSLDHSQK